MAVPRKTSAKKATTHNDDYPSYILRGFDPDLWRRVKAKCAMEGTTIKDVIAGLLVSWLKA